MISRDKLIETIRDDLENNLGLSVNTIVDISTFAKDLDEFKSLASIIEDEFQGLNTSFTNLDNTDGVNNNSNEADSNYTGNDIAEQQAILDAIVRRNKEEERNRLAEAARKREARKRELAAAAANKRARTSYTRTPNRLGSNNKNKKVNAKKKKTKKYSVADI